MSPLDWFFVGLLSFAVLCFLLGLFFIIYYFSIKKNIKTNWQRKPKKKVKRKKWIREKRSLEKQCKKYGKNTLVFFLLMILSTGAAFYARYYQLTNLTAEDAKIVVQGYLLTEDLEKNLITVGEGGSVEKVYPKVQEVSSLLVSYSNREVSKGLSEEGTRLLTQYRVLLRDVGTNLYSLKPEDLTNKEIIESYLKDIKKIKERQKKVFTYFKVNESALKQKT